MSDTEKGRKILEELATWFSHSHPDMNEATTRMMMIDKLFFDCLGWEKNDVNIEEAECNQYSDYSFHAPRRILIVEAKREGIYFDIPLDKKRIVYSLNMLMNVSDNIKNAVDQVMGYCQQRGVPNAVITNGHQLIAFVPIRSDGVSPLEGKALVFSSIDIMLSNFNDFWNSLSKEGIKEKYLFQKLSGGRIVTLPPKLSASISDYPGNRRRNIYQTDLQIVSELVFEDLVDSSELEARFLEECYCESGALSQYSLASKNILSARYSSLFLSDIPSPTTVSANSKKGITPTILSESLSQRPILLIGDVGVGKTTFIRNLITVNASDIFNDAITLYVDLGSQGNFADKINHFVLREMSKQLHENYIIDIMEKKFIRGVYRQDIERFKKSIYSDLLETNPPLYLEKELEYIEKLISDESSHLKCSLEHLEKAWRKQIVIIIDNADQRTEEVQQEAFLISQEFASHWPAIVFVALRPETFHHSMKQGALSGYHPKAYTIDPPRIDIVLRKRLDFALKITSGQISIKRFTDDTKLRLEKLDSIIKVFIESISFKDELIQFLDNITAGNVRLALDIVKNFFGSGHVNTEKIINLYQTNGNYIIPIHEFLRAVIYGDNEYFSPHIYNNISNILDISTDDPKEHFIQPLLIAVLASHNFKSGSDGFKNTNIVYQELQSFGFAPEQIDMAIIKCCTDKLIETSGRKRPQKSEDIPDSLRATTTGLYHINKLVNMFTYLDAVVTDTIILDKDIYDKLHSTQDIAQRLDRVELFKNYLDKCWKNISSAKPILDWDNMSLQLGEEINRIRERIKKSHPS